MTLIDTSAQIEFLRAAGSSTRRALHHPVESDDELHTTDVVVMEVLAGARDTAHLDQLRRLLARCEYVPVDGLADFEAVAALHRRCRAAGETVRALNDCLIAVVAIRAHIPVLHADRDFDALARSSALRTVAVD